MLSLYQVFARLFFFQSAQLRSSTGTRPTESAEKQMYKKTGKITQESRSGCYGLATIGNCICPLDAMLEVLLSLGIVCVVPHFLSLVSTAGVESC